jgi:phospholipase/carboxylesterase
MPSPARTELAASLAPASLTLAEARFVPEAYEPNYAYPLLVWLHGRGGDERWMPELMPSLSRRNHVGLSLRAPEPILRPGERAGFGWGDAFREPGGTAQNVAEPTDLVSALEHPVGAIEEAVFESIFETRRLLHVHSERVFLFGVGEGAALALRLGLSYPERFAGVISINGWLPSGFRPLARYPEARGFRVYLAQGEWSSRPRWRRARRTARLLQSAGMDVTWRSCPYLRPIPKSLLHDIDSWLIEGIAKG